MFERFSDRARRVVVLAQEEARLLNHNYIGTEHILLGLIREGDGVGANALHRLGISFDAVRAHVLAIVGGDPQAPSGQIPFTPRSKKVLEMALREALELGHDHIGTEHVLLGLIREGTGVAAQVLATLGADLDRVRAEVLALLGAQGAGPEMGEGRAFVRVHRGEMSVPAARCALCGRDLWDVDRFVRGAHADVCAECLRAARDALDASTERVVRLPPRGYGDPPPTTEEMAAIQRAFTDAQHGDPAAVEDGDTLMPYQAENKARHPGVEADFVVQRVRRVADDRAEVRFVIDVRTPTMQIPLDGEVVRRNERWAISRETFVAMLRLGGAQPPG